MKNLIKKIIKEEIDDFDWIRDTQPNGGLSWLVSNFGDLTKVVKDGKIYYVDSERKPLFYYYPGLENEPVYINYQRIWSVLIHDFGLKYSEIQELIKEWLEETYNLRGLTPTVMNDSLIPSWGEL